MPGRSRRSPPGPASSRPGFPSSRRRRCCSRSRAACACSAARGVSWRSCAAASRGSASRPALATGPTPRAALWLARGAGETLEALPVCALAPAPEALALLQRIGVRTLGELMRLPRAGLAPRFGQGLLDEIDRALGKVPEARSFFVPPERFSARLELPAPVAQAESVLFAARRLLLQLEGFLAARQAGVRGFALSLLHHGAQATRIEIGFAAPRRDAEHGLRLLRERLGALVLAQPGRGAAARGRRNGAAGRGHRGPVRRRAQRSGGLAAVARAPAGARGRCAGARPRAARRSSPGARLAHGGRGRAPVSGRPAPVVAARAAAPDRRGRIHAAGGTRAHRVGLVGRRGRGARLLHRRAQAAGSLAWIYRAPEGWFLHGLFA